LSIIVVFPIKLTFIPYPDAYNLTIEEQKKYIL